MAASRRDEFLNRLRTEVLPGDGALGTMLGDLGLARDQTFERLNASAPDTIRRIHAEYVAAGSKLIETNTFGANRLSLGLADGSDEVIELCRLGVGLAREAAGTTAFVAGSVGPIGLFDTKTFRDDELETIFAEPITALADAGADVILLETFTCLRQMQLALKAAKAKTDLPVIAQMAFLEQGHTQHGVHILTAYEAMKAGGADVIGSNCGRGVRCVAGAIDQMAGQGETFLSAFLNAGLPEYVDGRYRFGAPIPYLVDASLDLVAKGLNIIGGCCGTTPEFIRQLSLALGVRQPAKRVVAVAVETVVEVVPAEVKQVGPLKGSILHKMPKPGRKRPLMVVELDPPRGLDYAHVVKRARQLRDMGVDAITMADNPVATLHMGNLALADIVQKEADIPVILHLTCRDSNLLGLQSRLLESHTRGVHNILALTGDPAKVGDMPGATSVYDLNSFGLIELITKFNQGLSHAAQPLGGKTHFSIGVAFNPNGRNFAPLLDRIRRKAEKGAHYALTQPMYDMDRFDLMAESCKSIPIPIFVGVMPLISERNAEFLHNEVPGIVLSDDVRNRMKGFSGKEGRKQGTKIVCDLIDHMLPKSKAFYIVPPPKFTEMSVDLVAHIIGRTAEEPTR